MYEFTHGIDHVGKNGFAPILVIGKEICEQDFIERDLSDIQGIDIRQRGLDIGVRWQDLNIGLLGKKFPRLRYLHIEFGDQCDLSEFGNQPLIEDLTLICPKLKQKIDQLQFQNARKSKIQIPVQYFSNLISSNIEELELVRSKIFTLEELPQRRLLSKLRVVFARNLENLRGIENFPALIDSTFTDCPNLIEVGDNFQDSSIRQIWLAGVKKLRSIDGLVNARSLEKAFVIGSSKELIIPEAIRALVKDRA